MTNQSLQAEFFTDIDLRVVSDKEVVEALGRRASAGTWGRDVYASYINEAYLKALEEHAEEIVF